MQFANVNEEDPFGVGEEGRLLKIRDVIAYTGVSDSTLRRAVREGRLRAYHLPGGWRFRRADLDRWIDSYAIQPQPATSPQTRKLSEIFASEQA